MSSQLALFDYQQLDTETRIVVQQRTSEIKALMKRTAQDIIEIGEKMIDVKARLKHGQFGAWLEAEFEWTPMTANRFMNVAERFKNNNLLDSNFAPSALYLLAAPSVSNEARQEAIERAEVGEVITYTVAKQITQQYKPPIIQPPIFTKELIYERSIAPSVTTPIFSSLVPEWTQGELERKHLVELGETVIANKRLDGNLIEWARENNLFVPIDRGTIWGNPFVLEEDGTREQVIEKYRWYLNLKPSLQTKIDSLKGKVLGCWCYPESCHGNILKAGIEKPIWSLMI